METKVFKCDHDECESPSTLDPMEEIAILGKSKHWCGAYGCAEAFFTKALSEIGARCSTARAYAKQAAEQGDAKTADAHEVFSKLGEADAAQARASYELAVETAAELRQIASAAQSAPAPERFKYDARRALEVIEEHAGNVIAFGANVAGAVAATVIPGG